MSASLMVKLLAAGLALLLVAAAVLQAVNIVAADDALSRLRNLATAAHAAGIELPTARVAAARDLAIAGTVLCVAGLIVMGAIVAAGTTSKAQAVEQHDNSGETPQPAPVSSPQEARKREEPAARAPEPPHAGARSNSCSSTSRSQRSQLCFNPLSADHMLLSDGEVRGGGNRETELVQPRTSSHRPHGGNAEQRDAAVREAERSPLMVVHSTTEEGADHGGAPSPLAISSSEEDIDGMFTGSPTRAMGATTRPGNSPDSRRARRHRSRASADESPASPDLPPTTVPATSGSAARSRLATFDTSAEVFRSDAGSPVALRRADTGMSSVAPTTPMLRQNTMARGGGGGGTTSAGGERYSDSYTPSNAELSVGHGWEVTPDRYRSVVLCAKLHMPSVQAVSADVIRTFHARMSQVARQLNSQLRGQHFSASLTRREADCVVLVLRRRDDAAPSPSAAVHLGRKIVREEGVMALWRGTGAAVTRILPYSGGGM